MQRQLGKEGKNDKGKEGKNELLPGTCDLWLQCGDAVKWKVDKKMNAAMETTGTLCKKQKKYKTG